MTSITRKEYKRVIILNKDNTVKTEIYMTTYQDIYNYIKKNHQEYECPLHILRDIMNNKKIAEKYEEKAKYIKMNMVLKNQIPKHSIIMARYDG